MTKNKNFAEIKSYFLPYEKELLENQDILWQLFQTALQQKPISAEELNNTLLEAQQFFNILLTSSDSYQRMEDLIINHIRGRKSIFVFMEEKELFLNSVSEYVSKILPFEKRTGFLNILFKFKQLIEDIAWQTEAKVSLPREIVTEDFFRPMKAQLFELLKEVFMWVNPLMAIFFVADQKGEMHAMCVVGKDKTIFDDLDMRTSISSKWGQGPVGEVFRREKPTIVYNRQDPRLGPFLKFWEEQGINGAILLPVTRGHFKFGVLAITFPTELKETVDIAGRLANYLDKLSNFLIVNYKDSQEKIYHALLTSNYTKSLQTIVSLLEKKDPYTAFHSQLVTEYAQVIAGNLNLPGEELEILRVGAVLHDIGKVGILDKILLKNTALNEEEWSLMKRHPELGCQIINQMGIQPDISDIILYHHERWDGRGYPSGMKGEEIPLLVRIVTIADAFEAITSHRPYRAAHDIDYAKIEIAQNSSTQFDPMLVEYFQNIPKEKFIQAKDTILTGDTKNVFIV